ncbi:MAG: permease-like cell division protein FtsX [bacterium]
MLVSILRIIKFSFQDIFRNVWLSLVTVLILILTLFSVNLLLIVKVISSATVENIKQKIDISLYLDTEAGDEQIIALKNRITLIEEVEEVGYISKEEALDKFRQKHRDDPDIIASLQELENNPLTPSLVIKAKDINQYNVLINKLNKIDDQIIESRDFADHKAMLERINSITKKVSDAGFLVSAIFIFITILVIYNTVRIGIYSHRGEVTIMRLVGASNWFIKTPFLVSSLIYTLFSMLVVIGIIYLFLGLLQPYLQTFFMGYDINLISHFNQNFFSIFGLQFLIALAINMLASLIAVSKYSHV